MMRRYFLERTLKWWRDNGLSDLTKKHYDIRKHNYNIAQLYNVTLDYDNDLLKIFWKIYPTFAGGKEFVKTYDTEGRERSDFFYYVIVAFGDLEDFLELYKQNERIMDKVKFLSWAFDNWENVKLYSNDPSYFI